MFRYFVILLLFLIFTVSSCHDIALLKTLCPFSTGLVHFQADQDGSLQDGITLAQASDSIQFSAINTSCNDNENYLVISESVQVLSDIGTTCHICLILPDSQEIRQSLMNIVLPANIFVLLGKEDENTYTAAFPARKTNVDMPILDFFALENGEKFNLHGTHFNVGYIKYYPYVTEHVYAVNNETSFEAQKPTGSHA